MKLSTALCVYVLCICSMIFIGITIVLEKSAARHHTEEASRITSMMQKEMIASVAWRLEHSRECTLDSVGHDALLREEIYGMVESLRPYPDSRSYLMYDVDKRNFKDCTKEVDGILYIYNYAPLPRIGAVLCTVTPYDEVAQSVRSLKIPLVIVVGVGFLLLIAGIWFVMHRGSKPLHRLAQAADAIADGDFSAPLPPRMRFSDLEQLRDAMQKMEGSIQGHVARQAAELAERSRLQGELEMAASIQRNMLPDLDTCHHPGLKVAGLLHTALEVGGDLYDVVTIDSDVYFIIADVSGKGMPASLVMASVRSLFRFAAAMKLTPAEILDRVNRQLAEGNAGCMFVTAIAGRFDSESGDMLLANAGHTPPLVVGRNTHFISMPPMLPLGVMDDTVYADMEVLLGFDESLLLYTDGVTEAEAHDGSMFGQERLLWNLSNSNGTARNPFDIVRIVEKSVSHFASHLKGDDMTMLCLSPLAAKEHVELRYDTSQLARLAEWVENFGIRCGWPSKLTMHVNLVLEEAVSNVMLHSEAPSVDARIEVTLEQTRCSRRATVTDGGPMFNPAVYAVLPDTEASVDKRLVGGLGIHMMKKIARELKFEYKNKKNILTIIF